MITNQAREIQFGWGDVAHRIIERGAGQLLASPSLKQFYNRHLPLIHQTSNEEDTLRAGSQHYLDVECLYQKDLKSVNQPQTAFEAIRDNFSRTNLHQQKQLFRQQPLEQELYKIPDNVIHYAFGLYHTLVGKLAHIKQFPPSTPLQKQEARKHLACLMGAVAHYVGDGGQPMHTTAYHTWPLLPPTSKREETKVQNDAHLFFEVGLFQRRKSARFWFQPKQGQVPTAPQKPIMQLLSEQLQKGHVDLYRMVRQEGLIRDRLKDPVSYRQQLAQAWQPIAQKHVTEAATNLACVLQKAYHEAGQPNLSRLG